MKYQVNAFTSCLKKSLFYYIVLFLIVLYNSLHIRSSTTVFDIEVFENILGINVKITSLFFLYQLFLMIYTTVLFLGFEINNSMEFTATRINKISIFYKVCILIGFILFFRIFYSYIVYIFLKSSFEIKLIHFLKSIIIYLFITLFFIPVYMAIKMYFNKMNGR